MLAHVIPFLRRLLLFIVNQADFKQLNRNTFSILRIYYATKAAHAFSFFGRVFTRMMHGLASEAADEKTIMIDATCLKAHRTASSLRVKKGV